MQIGLRSTLAAGVAAVGAGFGIPILATPMLLSPVLNAPIFSLPLLKKPALA
jgi:hypothetical protein